MPGEFPYRANIKALKQVSNKIVPESVHSFIYAQLGKQGFKLSLYGY